MASHLPYPPAARLPQDGVGAYVHKILHVIEPMLIDADYYVRVEGREVIANLSKAVGE